MSHASQDEEVSLCICSFLEARGIGCWVAPRDVRPGRRYGEEIVAAIANADAVVHALSENANSSTFVEREIDRPRPARTGGFVSIAGLQHHPRQRIRRSGETVTEPLIGIQADVETNNRIKILSNGFGASGTLDEAARRIFQSCILDI